MPPRFASLLTGIVWMLSMKIDKADTRRTKENVEITEILQEQFQQTNYQTSADRINGDFKEVSYSKSKVNKDLRIRSMELIEDAGNIQKSESTPLQCLTGYDKTQGLNVTINNSCKMCGHRCCRRTTKRVPGGENANHGEFPWHATIWKRVNIGWRYICGGVLVSDQHILTAAHCFARLCLRTPKCGSPSLGNYRVSVGETDIRLNSDGIRRYLPGLMEAISLACHESFRITRTGMNQYDVALVQLRRPTKNQIACMTHTEIEANATRNCYSIGHGATGTNATRLGSSRLQKVPVILRDAASCKNMFGHHKEVLSNVHACVYSATGTAGCKLDSGSPVLCPENPDDRCSPYVVRGIFSNIRKSARCQDNQVTYLTNLFGLSGWSPVQWAAYNINFDLTSPTCVSS